jgi:catechol 2,3-dioxygenase-like lactoylglutathione lyase family enzyme
LSYSSWRRSGDTWRVITWPAWAWAGTRPERHITITYTGDPRVDAYIDALPGWQQVICRQVRDLVHAADREVTETIKFTNRPYFVLQGNICALLAAKDHVNVFLYDGAIVPDPENIITGGHDNKTARTVAVRQNETINASALTAMFKQIIANNRAGGWRKLQRWTGRGHRPARCSDSNEHALDEFWRWSRSLIQRSRGEEQVMFENTKAFSGFAVDDVPRARGFYEETLGLRVSEDGDILTLHLAGDRDTLVYPKPDFTPATYTILNFPVEDIETTVDELVTRGVNFERYDGFDQDERGISRTEGGPLIAWFRDPAGNILSVLEM